MVAKYGIYFLIFKIVASQLDGQFWWLNEKLAKHKGITPPSVQFEKLVQNGNDETDKIVFRNDDNDEKKVVNKTIPLHNSIKKDFSYKDKTKLVWPSQLTNDTKTVLNINRTRSKNVIRNQNNSGIPTGDIFNFHLPDNGNLISWPDVKSTPYRYSAQNNQKLKIQDNIVFRDDKQNIKNKLLYICKYITKEECIERDGFIHIPANNANSHNTFRSQLVCCIQPSYKSKLNELTLPRYKRSYPQNLENTALKQRDNIMLRKLAAPTSQAFRLKKLSDNTRNTDIHKMSSENEENVDPYWNIKNSNFKNPKIQTASNFNPNYEHYDEIPNDYVEDYVVELPKPGLGVYSNYGKKISTWTYIHEPSIEEEGSDEDLVPNFGYGFLDPRIVNRFPPLTQRPGRSKKPIKIQASSSDEYSYDSDSHTIRYQSDPDFKVFEDFKLFNILRNQSRIFSKNSKKKRTENLTQGLSERPLEDTEFPHNIDNFNDQAYQGCGQSTNYEEIDEHTEEADISHPWLVLVVLTKRHQTIICYATLVHPRAAVTAGDCVSGASPGDISILAGVSRLNDAQRRMQDRMVSLVLHPSYKPGIVANNLAILHWKRPLRLGDDVQPACLADHEPGDKCQFIGWGGYDQALHLLARWQQASILSPQACLGSLTKQKLLTVGTFCVAIDSRAAVTGIGGGLICSANGRSSVVGVAVRREHVIILTMLRQWVLEEVESLELT